MEQLGIEPLQILAQIFNFVALLVVLKIVLYKPILKSLEERRKKIKEGLDYAQKMQVEEEITDKKRLEVLRKAKIEAQSMIEESKKEGKITESEIIEKAKQEADAMLTKAREELANEKKEMERELRTQTVEIAEVWLESVLGKYIEEKNQMQIINKKLKDLAKT